MRFYVKAKPKSGKSELMLVGKGNYQAFLKASPQKNKANLELIDLIANYFQISKSRVKIITGKTAKTKLIEIN